MIAEAIGADKFEIVPEIVTDSGTDSKIAKAAVGSNTLVGKGLALQGKVAQENRAFAKKSVDDWLTGLGMKN